MDVFIPCAAKDIGVLPLCVAAIRQHCTPKVGRIIVVSAADPKLPDVKWLSEDIVIPDLTIATMPKIFYTSVNRTGWYFQQFLKYGVSSFSADEHYAAFDSDLILIARRELLNDKGQPVLQRSGQWHQPYFETFKKLLGFDATHQMSFIADHMVFNVGSVRRLMTAMERPGVAWWQAILQHIHGTNISEFADYETYGQWIAKHEPGSFENEMFRNIMLPFETALFHERNARECRARGFRSIAYHNRPGFNHPWPVIQSTLNVEPGRV